MLSTLDQIEKKALTELENITDESALQSWRVSFLAATHR